MNIIFLIILWEFHIPIPLISYFLWIFYVPCQRKTKKSYKNKIKIKMQIMLRTKQTRRKLNKANKTKTTLLLHLSSLSATSSFVLVALGAVCHAVEPFVQLFTSLCDVLGQVQGLWLLVHRQCWTLTDSPPGYLWFSRAMETLCLHAPVVINGVDVRACLGGD